MKISPENITDVLKDNYYGVMSIFYETQSSFLSGIYKKYNGIETANIALCFLRNLNLEIIRQREKDLNFDISLENYKNNINKINKPVEKISSIVEITGIPKETARRKIKKLLSSGILSNSNKNKGYTWNFLSKTKESYSQSLEEIKALSKFTQKFASLLNLNLEMKTIEQEIRSEFSFYWYHFLSCQLQWLQMWQYKLKDNDLLLISLQATIPTLNNSNKNSKNLNIDNLYKIIGKTAQKENDKEIAVSATSVSDITGIPRATCIRKLNKLVMLGFLLREEKSKRYFINQNSNERTRTILTNENVGKTITIFSHYLSIILNSLSFRKKNASKFSSSIK